MSLEPRSIPYKSNEILVLSKGQLDRIGAQLYDKRTKEDAAKAITDNRKSLKEASKKRTDAWSNTFAGFHKQRLKNAELRTQKIEAMRCRVDDLEEMYQEIRKQYVLDMAKRKLYHQTDRVKNLHAAMHLSEAISGRKEQIQHKNKVNHAFDELDGEYIRCMREDVEQYHEEIDKKALHQKSVAEKNAVELKKQAKITTAKKEQEKLEELREGRALRELADQYEQEDVNKLAFEKEKRLDYGKALADTVAKNMEIQEARLLLDAAENKRNELFNDAKLEMKKALKTKTEELNNLKEERKLRISSKLLDDAGYLQRQEEKILRKAIKQKKAKEKREIKKKEQKEQQTMREINEFYQNKVKTKKEAVIQEIRDHLNERRQLEDLYEQLTREHEEKESKREQVAKDNEHTQLHQIAKKRLQRKQAAEGNDYSNLVNSLYEEEDTFQEYAKILISECEAKGWNTYPMKKAARPGIECGKGPLFVDKCNIRPKYYASITDPDELHYVKRKVNTGLNNTKSRLGFGEV